MAMWLDIIRNRIQGEPVRTVLDVGCGTGRFSEGLATVFDADVIGIDSAESMLARAWENIHHPRVSFLPGNTESLPTEDGSVCLVFLPMVYHHIENPEKAAARSRKGLRPNSSRKRAGA